MSSSFLVLGSSPAAPLGTFMGLAASEWGLLMWARPSGNDLDLLMAHAVVEEPRTRGAWWWASIPGIIGPELAEGSVEGLRALRARVAREWVHVCRRCREKARDSREGAR